MRKFTYEEFVALFKEYNFKPRIIDDIWNTRPSDELEEEVLRQTCVEMAQRNPKGYLNQPHEVN